jgi:hypothetical protein
MGYISFRDQQIRLGNSGGDALVINSNRTVTSNHTISGLIFKSTVASGTAPLAVTSTTKVANLNVDRLDNLHAASFLNNSFTTNGTFRTTGNIHAGYGSGCVSINTNDGQGNANVTFNHHGRVPDADGSSYRIVTDVDSTTPSMAFLMVGDVTAGTSVAAAETLKINLNDVRYKNHIIWHNGNDGSGSGLDADLLRGRVLSTGSGANTVALRSGSGDISARLFRSEYDTTNDTIGFIMTQVNTGSDNFIRPSTPAQLIAALPAANLRDKIKTVDGSGSGLDADLVDGLHAGSFLRSDAGDTATGYISFNGNIRTRQVNGFGQELVLNAW